MYQGLLCRRILTAWGIGRSGARINAHFETIFAAMHLRKTEADGKIIYWVPYQDPQQYTTYRIPAKEADKRDPEDLPPPKK